MSFGLFFIMSRDAARWIQMVRVRAVHSRELLDSSGGQSRLDHFHSVSSLSHIVTKEQLEYLETKIGDSAEHAKACSFTGILMNSPKRALSSYQFQTE